MTFLSCEQTLSCLFESKMYKSYGKKKGILLPRNYLKFPLVKVIVSTIPFWVFLSLQKNKVLFTLPKMKFFFRGFCNLGIFLGGGCRPFFKMINIFACTCPNRSGVGAIDNPDRFEQAFVQYYIPEDPEKNFHARHFDGPSSKKEHFGRFKNFCKQNYLL